eukprot:2323584-Pyramimonas_sp.AAC.1
MAELLLAVGADVNSRNREGMTALHLAAREGHAKLAQLLIDHGADPSTADHEGCTPYILGQVRDRTSPQDRHRRSELTTQTMSRTRRVA